MTTEQRPRELHHSDGVYVPKEDYEALRKELLARQVSQPNRMIVRLRKELDASERRYEVCDEFRMSYKDKLEESETRVRILENCIRYQAGLIEHEDHRAEGLRKTIEEIKERK